MSTYKKIANDFNGTRLDARNGPITVKVMAAQQKMMWVFGLKFGLGFGFGIVSNAESVWMQSVFVVIYTLAAILVSTSVFRLTYLLYGVGPAIIATILTLLPCFGTVIVLAVDGFTMSWLRARAVYVEINGGDNQTTGGSVESAGQLISQR